MSFEGTYATVSSDKYDEYLKEVGVGMIERTIASKAKPDMIYKKNGDQWTQRTESTLKTFEITFTPGVEFDEQTADGRTVKAVINIDGNKLIHKQTKDGKEAQTVREFKANGEMVATFTSGGVTAIRTYKKKE